VPGSVLAGTGYGVHIVIALPPFSSSSLRVCGSAEARAFDVVPAYASDPAPPEFEPA
jgi:hypothetical protein